MKLLVLDGNSILNRAFYGIKLLSTKDGFYTNGIYGFLTMLEKVKEDVSPDATAIAFDVKAKTFRHEEYEGYKATRKGMPEELAEQLPVLKELLSDLGYALVECEGYEADDILGTFAKTCSENCDTCIIATGDRDSLQLVDSNVTVRLLSTKFGKADVTVYDEEKIYQEYNVSPKQLIDIKALQGDSSDNIPGVKGIGKKGASDLISKFGSIKNIYDNIETIDITANIKNKLLQDKENAFLSYKLGTIVKNVPVDTEAEHYIKKPTSDKAIRTMVKLEFFSLIKKMDLTTEDNKVELQYDLEKLNITKSNSPKIELEETNYLLPKYNSTGSLETLAIIKDQEIILIEACKENLNILFKDSNKKFITHDCKKLISSLIKLNVKLPAVVFDSMLASYLINPSSSNYNISRLKDEYGARLTYETATEDDKDFIDECAVYKSLCERLKEKIHEYNNKDLLQNIEIPLSYVLSDMENLGFGVDEDGLKKYSCILHNKSNEIEREIFNLAGEEFNVKSPKQLGAILFEKLGLPHGKKLKSGYSTNAEILEKLSYDYPIVNLILEYRTLTKLKSTYCDGIIKVISEDGRVHTSFNQTETRTGRISSTEPNMQNIPVRTEVGKELRKFFTAKDGHLLVDADYSQIELRVLAHIADDKIMIDAFNNNDDIHAITASQVFHLPADMVTSLMRRKAKAVNFGIVYGIGAFSLSKNLNISRKEASEYIQTYLEKYQGVNNYMKTVVDKAKQLGYVDTMFNRRRYLPELASSNFNMRAFGERVAMNMPIQGTAADIIKLAMINVDKRLKSEKLKSKIILQVHDELIIESPQNEAEFVSKLLKEEMENAVKLSVPLTVDVSLGKTWYDTKE